MQRICPDWKGRSVFPIVVALRQWGERYMFEQGETYSVLLDNAHGQPSVSGCAFRSGDKLQPGDCLSPAHLCQIPAPNNGVEEFAGYQREYERAAKGSCEQS